MKKALSALLLLVCVVAYAQTNGFNSLTTLAGGTWQMKTGKTFIGERWTQAGDNELKGFSFKTASKDTTILENVTLVRRGENIFYVVKQPGEEQPVYFKLSDSNKKKFVFSNDQHDFPQRIVYQFVSQDSIHAWIDGHKDGKYAKQDFYYKRVYNKN